MDKHLTYSARHKAYVVRRYHANAFWRCREGAFGRGQHWEGGGFYPSMFAGQRWFRAEGRARRDPITRLLRFGGQVVFF